MVRRGLGIWTVVSYLAGMNAHTWWVICLLLHYRVHTAHGVQVVLSILYSRVLCTHTCIHIKEWETHLTTTDNRPPTIQQSPLCDHFGTTLTAQVPASFLSHHPISSYLSLLPALLSPHQSLLCIDWPGTNKAGYAGSSPPTNHTPIPPCRGSAKARASLHGLHRRHTPSTPHHQPSTIHHPHKIILYRLHPCPAKHPPNHTAPSRFFPPPMRHGW